MKWFVGEGRENTNCLNLIEGSAGDALMERSVPEIRLGPFAGHDRALPSALFRPFVFPVAYVPGCNR